MTDLLIASTEADATAVEAVVEHHAAMAGALNSLVVAVIGAARSGDDLAVASARARLDAWCREDLLPHLLGEEATLYPAAAGTVEGRLLVEAMAAEIGVIAALVDEASAAPDALAAATAARALRAVFDSHVVKENDLVLPLLARTPEVSVAALVEVGREIAGSRPPGEVEEAQGCGSGGHSCSCGEADAAGYPELDARTIPHAIRHATIFGALDTLPAGAGLVLVAPHDPLPLLAQLAERSNNGFTVEYRERGPEAWRLLLVRRSA